MLRNGGIYAPSVHSHYADHRINFISRTRPIQGSVRCHQIIIINSLPHVRPIKKRGRSWQEPFEPHLHGHTLWLDSYQCPQVQNNPHVPQLSPFGFNRGPECKCGQYHYSIPIHPPAPRHWHWYWILIGRAGLNVVDIVVVASSVVTEQQSSSLRFPRLLNVLSSSRRRVVDRLRMSLFISAGGELGWNHLLITIIVSISRHRSVVLLMQTVILLPGYMSQSAAGNMAPNNFYYRPAAINRLNGYWSAEWIGE